MFPKGGGDKHNKHINKELGVVVSVTRKISSVVARRIIEKCGTFFRLGDANKGLSENLRFELQRSKISK